MRLELLCLQICVFNGSVKKVSSCSSNFTTTTYSNMSVERCHCRMSYSCTHDVISVQLTKVLCHLKGSQGELSFYGKWETVLKWTSQCVHTSQFICSIAPNSLDSKGYITFSLHTSSTWTRAFQHILLLKCTIHQHSVEWYCLCCCVITCICCVYHSSEARLRYL